MTANNQSKRLVSLAIAAVILMTGLSTRMWFLQTVKAEENEEIVVAVRTRTIRLLPERGRIIDADRRVIACLLYTSPSPRDRG